MNATPLICPRCGELVIAWVAEDGTVIVPSHVDRITPNVSCLASATAVTVTQSYFS